MAHVSGGGEDQSKGRADRTPIWTTLITALATVIGSILGFVGVLYTAGGRIESGPPATGPTVTETQTVNPTGPAPTATVTVTKTVGPNGDTTAATEPEPSASEVALDVNWNSDSSDYWEKIGTTVQFDCPPRGVPQSVYGDILYADNSSVCTAAVHDGRITLAKGGKVVLQIREGTNSYKGARRNGITSEALTNDANSSFEFLPVR
jgi:hypothetical protein